jgi:hypothetical protein
MYAGATDSEVLELAEEDLAKALASSRNLSDTASGRRRENPRAQTP